jgi:hypothetical protein
LFIINTINYALASTGIAKSQTICSKDYHLIVPALKEVMAIDAKFDAEQPVS